MTKVTAFRLLKQIEIEGDRATKGILREISGGEEGYERYFGENGHLTRKWSIVPHRVTGVRAMVEYHFVDIWEEEISGKKTILHKRTEDGKHYQNLLWLQLFYFEPYSEVSGGKLQRK